MTAAPDRPVVLVTGGSRGIGRAIATELGRTHHVLVGGRDAASVQEVVDALPSAAPFVAELTDGAALERACEGVDRLDVLVHSAGIVRRGRVDELSREDWVSQLEVNVVAVAELTRMLLPRLRASQGQVITINSGSGHTSSPGNGSYAASKFALRALTNALREEERGQVRVCAIHPGRVDTDMQVEIQAAMGNDYDGSLYLRPESVAATVRLAVDATPEAMIEELSIRPV